MKTKTLILMAAMAVVGGISALAQTPVYSQNIVGYVNVVCPVGYSMIANPLNAPTQTVAALFSASTPDGTSVFKFNGSGYASAQFIDGSWEGSAISIAPGEGVFVQIPSSETHPFTNTFVGEVVLSSTNAIPSGYSIRSSVVPQAGLLSALSFPAAEGDSVFLFRNGAYVSSQLIDGSWEGAGEPNVNVGESFFVQKQVAANWVRNFTVN